MGGRGGDGGLGGADTQKSIKARGGHPKLRERTKMGRWREEPEEEERTCYKLLTKVGSNKVIH